MIAILTDVCQNYLHFTRGYHREWMLHGCYQLFKMAQTSGLSDSWSILNPSQSDAAAVQVAWNIEACCKMLCNCQMAFKKKQSCLALRFQMTLTKPAQSASSRDEGCAGIWQWDFMPQWEWILKLTAMHMEGAKASPRSPVSQYRGGDKQNSSSGGGSF